MWADWLLPWSKMPNEVLARLRMNIRGKSTHETFDMRSLFKTSPSYAYAYGVVRCACSPVAITYTHSTLTSQLYYTIATVCTQHPIRHSLSLHLYYEYTTKPVLGIPHHHLLWHYHWGYRRHNSDSKARPTWHTDHLVVILTSGSWEMCLYVIHQQGPWPPVILHCSSKDYCEENHCHSKPNRQHVHVGMISMYHTWYSLLRYCVWEVVHVALQKKKIKKKNLQFWI